MGGFNKRDFCRARAPLASLDPSTGPVRQAGGVWCAFPEEAQSAGKSSPGHRTAPQLVCSIHICPRPLLLPPGAREPF